MEYLKEEMTKDFIKRLPDLTVNPPSVHLMMLAIRSRKAREILGQKVHDLVVEREIVRPIQDWRMRYFNSVYNLSVLQHNGRYEYKGMLVPGQTMGIFATLSPRNVNKAITDVMKENVDFLPMVDESSKMELTKISSRYFGALHRHKQTGFNYVTLDLDNDDKTIYKQILDEVSTYTIFMCTETSRGFHIVLNITAPDEARRFYGKNGTLQQLGLKYGKDKLEFQRDAQEPCPGSLYYRKKGELHYVTILQ